MHLNYCCLKAHTYVVCMCTCVYIHIHVSLPLIFKIFHRVAGCSECRIQARGQTYSVQICLCKELLTFKPQKHFFLLQSLLHTELPTNYLVKITDGKCITHILHLVPLALLSDRRNTLAGWCFLVTSPALWPLLKCSEAYRRRFCFSRSQVQSRLNVLSDFCSFLRMHKLTRTKFSQQNQANRILELPWFWYYDKNCMYIQLYEMGLLFFRRQGKDLQFCINNLSVVILIVKGVGNQPYVNLTLKICPLHQKATLVP